MVNKWIGYTREVLIDLELIEQIKHNAQLLLARNKNEGFIWDFEENSDEDGNFKYYIRFFFKERLLVSLDDKEIEYYLVIPEEFRNCMESTYIHKEKGISIEEINTLLRDYGFWHEFVG